MVCASREFAETDLTWEACWGTLATVRVFLVLLRLRSPTFLGFLRLRSPGGRREIV